MRKHVAWYTAGMRHSAGLRRESNLISSYQELEALLDRMTEQNLGNNLQSKTPDFCLKQGRIGRFSA